VTPEGKVKAGVKRILDSLGCYYFFPQSGAFGRSGIPDIIGCYKGKFFGIECKAGKGTTTALQDKELQKIEDAEGIALLVNEHNIEEVEKCLRNF
jgi:Holliday junction resolvase